MALTFIVLFLVSLPVFGASPHSSNNSEINSHPTENSYQSQVIIASAFPTSTLWATNTEIPTGTLTPTLTATSTPLSTYHYILQPTETSTARPTLNSYFPFIPKEEFIPTATPLPPKRVLFCDNLNQPIYIPDNKYSGVSDDISITDNRILVDLNLYMNISHTWVGDLVITLINQDSGKAVTVLNRPGATLGSCYYDNIIAVLEDAAAQPVDEQCAAAPAAISGIYLPGESFDSYTGSTVSGRWVLNVSDHSSSDVGYVNHWCLETSLSDALPPPTPTPTPVSLPSSAFVSGMSGQDQQFNLDCESRSAVDWAGHFGIKIDEFDFLNHLPPSDDPETGFVGDPDGTWGQIPPDDYGVHTPPVAQVLQYYGLTASAYHSLQWDDLRAEIASGYPAIVWIIGGSSRNLINGIPHYYTARSTGNTTIVAPLEHTVILVGYTPTTVTVLNGSKFVEVPLNQFLDSWSVLQFMAVLARPP